MTGQSPGGTFRVSSPVELGDGPNALTALGMRDAHIVRIPKEMCRRKSAPAGKMPRCRLNEARV